MSTKSHRVIITPTSVENLKSKAWHSQSVEEVLAQLGSATDGLSALETGEVIKRFNIAPVLQ